MDSIRTTFFATLVVIGTGVIWGFYWLPVRAIAELGLTGAWGTLAIVSAATLLLLPLGWRGRHALAASDPIALIAVALGGFAFFLYSVGFLYGRVAVIIILFFLTPVWSTLIGHYVMGWLITRTRVVVLVVGAVGMALMFGAEGEMPIPRGMGEWLGLTSGFLWALATVGIKVKATAGPGESAFLFAAGASFGGLLLAPFLEPFPDIQSLANPLTVAIWVFVTGGIWWAVLMGGLMWAATKLEPARVGILLMAELLIAPLTAAVVAGERLASAELLGGALVLVAGILEVVPARWRKRSLVR